MKNSVAIDLVPILPGKGGSGSGIWTYARELVRQLDRLAPASPVKILVLINKEQAPFFHDLEHLQVVGFPVMGRFMRLLWVHVWLPIWCLLNRVQALHKLASETPYWLHCQRITTVHDFYHEFVARAEPTSPSHAARYFTWITRVALRKSQHLIAVSATTAREMQARCSSATQIAVIHNGVRPASRDQRACASSSTQTLLYVSKLMPYKGQMQALAAFSTFRQQDPPSRQHIRLRLHGFENDPDFVAALDRRLAQDDLKGFVDRSPYNPEATLDQIYADAFAVLFLTAYEGFGLPIIEAQARCLPVICSDIPVLREVGGDGPWYVDRDDPDAVAQAIAAMMDNDSERARRVALGLENSKRFSWEKAAEVTLQVYTKCIHPTAPIIESRSRNRNH